MNKRRLIMMLSVLIVTILIASGFYLLTGEANSGLITINSTETDYEKVPDSNGPYGTEGHKYYIRYTGKVSGRTVVDLSDTHVTKAGKDLKGCGLTVKDGYPYIFGQKIESTYKMFSNNDSITRVFVPASIAIKSNGISTNTFDGSTNQEIDCIYHTGELSTDDKNLGSGLKLNGTYDKTAIISQNNIYTYVYLGNEDFYREILDLDVEENTLGSNQSSYAGELQNIYVSKEVSNIDFLFSRAGIRFSAFTNQKGNLVHKVLLDDDGKWNTLTWLFVLQTELDLSEKFYIPHSDEVKSIASMFWGTNITHLPQAFTIPENVENMYGVFNSASQFSGKIKIPNSVKMMNTCFTGAGIDSNENIDKTGCPIVMEYEDTNIPSLAYRSNVKDLVKGGVVYKKLYDWEIVYDNTEEDENEMYNYTYTDVIGRKCVQNYYFHYRGNATTVDLIKAATDKTLGNVDGQLTIKDTKDTNGNNITQLFGIDVTNTYKMFAKNDNYDNNQNITRVFIPASIAITNNGIKGNTFYKTTQAIDCIYHTGEVKTGNSENDQRAKGITADYDKTNSITENDNSNVITYVYLGNENINHTSQVGSQAYVGIPKNVFVSNEVNNPASLFSRHEDPDNTTEIKYALLDDGSTWYKNKKSLWFMFYKQSEFEFPPHFQLPTEMYHSAKSMFAECTSITELPSDFKLSEDLDSIIEIFRDCENLTGTINIPSHITNMKDAFLGAGTNSKKEIGSTQCPIVLTYEDDCIAALAYRVNVKGLDLETDGKVYKELYDWEIIYDSNGKNSFDYNPDIIAEPTTILKQNYYFHYRGNAKTVDLGVADENNKLTISSTGVPQIFGIDVTDTYKMFAKNDKYDHNQDITRVFVPSSIAITNDGLNQTMFANTTQEIDCIYHTGTLSTSDKNLGAGLTLNGKYDKTNVFDDSNTNNKTNVVPYVYLGEENFYREILKLTPVENSLGENQYSYMGSIQNIYISKEITDVRFLFSRYGSGGFQSSSNFSNQKSSLIHKVLFDDSGNWDAMTWLFVLQTELDLSEKFYIPHSDGVKSIASMFWGTNITHLPQAFTIPKNVESMYGVFEKASYFSGTVEVPKSVTNILLCFNHAGEDTKTTIGTTGKPIVAKVVTGSYADTTLTSANYSTVYIERVATLSLDNQSQPAVISDINTTNQSSGENADKIVIEDETDWISVTVNKKSVDETVTETQETSQSVESVESENKEDEVEE